MIIGSHVDMVSPNFVYGSVKQAISYGANALMLYTGAPQNSIRRPISQLKKEEAYIALKEAGIDRKNVIVHAPYIINLGNTINKELLEKSKALLLLEIKRTEELGFNKLVLHPGAHMKQGADVAICQLVQCLNEIFDMDHSHVQVCIETMSGKGSEIGATLEEVAQIVNGIHDQSRIGVCLDTCHLSDAGYDLKNLDAFIEIVKNTIGLERAKVIHLNDSKNPLGSHKDRHENIGYGHIGFETLYQIAIREEWKDVPKILETPYVNDLPPYKEEIEALRNGKRVKIK